MTAIHDNELDVQNAIVHFIDEHGHCSTPNAHLMTLALLSID
jgi:hypothetical protein